MTLLHARHSAAVPLKKGQSLQVINTHGKQVVDFWAFNPKDSHDYLSTSHTQAMLLSISLRKGDNLYSSRRKPILTLVDDTTPGIHDLLFPACDAERYRMLGAVGYHDSCHDNMHKALKDFPDIKVTDDWAPGPLNLFMNVAVDHHGGLNVRAPTSDKGQYVILRAETDLVVVMSACPQDMVNVNADGPADCEYRVIEDSDKALLDRLLKENAELRANRAQSESPQGGTGTGSTPWHPTPTSNQDVSAGDDQILEESDWFTHTRSSDTPIWIGEISDAAFSTRFRQFASASQLPKHIPRTQFTSDDTLRDLAATRPVWPSAARAQLLVETALQFVQHHYHIVRKTEVLSALGSISSCQYSAGANPSNEAKLWALFAIGELRLSRCLSPIDRLPGLSYFAFASDAARTINERPQLDVIETILLLMILALYSLEVNRRHSACTYVGSAMRLATIMGLHMNIGDAYLADSELKEHRIRVWWSVYILDRFLSSKIGLPLSISDADISVDLPSTSSTLNSDDFGDHGRLVAIIHLGRIAGNISRSLYVRTPQRGTFLQRVTKIREELDHWKLELPDHLKFDIDHDRDSDRYQPSIWTLELIYNQLLILATRPVLLFLFRRHRDRGAITSTDSNLPDQAQDVADACIHSARQSCQLLVQFWANGQFHIFHYSYVRYLFSAATILAISSTLDRGTSQDDKGNFDLVTGFLQQLEQNGNPAAMEFYSHIKETQAILETQRSSHPGPNVLHTDEDLGLSHSTEPIHPLLNGQQLTTPGSSDIALQAVDDSPLNLSFLDDWIYDNALTQLCWQEE
ncbi:hypothetical protein FSARC_11494 [Fusarium sarcochroum]|uniref:Xylanolytic transcriptional activator regulatory domain-containing protein n=1 Tax=Fusarium sarcochroum TaxID=1208366 RepID=A0A8H4TFA7_9HYPO|nr:hypothetical protein FSARC_11494 [Fusarium sarcochroum]